MRPFRSFRASFQTALALALLGLGLTARAGSPRLTHIYPSGGQRGAEAVVTFSGTNLSDSREILFNEPGFKCTKVKSDGTHFEAKIKIAPETRLGEHLCRVVTASGISDVRPFFVSPFPMVEGKHDKSNPDKPMPVALNTTVYGHTPGAQQDRYLLELKKGERLTAEVVGAKLQTQNVYDSIVQITREDGTLVTEVDDVSFTRQDPIATIVAPEDGKYVVMVKDSTNAGLGECHYLMHLGNFSQPLAVFPPGGQVGEEMAVQLLGDPAGPVTASLKLPAEPNDRFEVRAPEGTPAPLPNLFRVSTFPNVLEAEPNDDPAHATVASGELPLAFNGVISQKGDVDYFKFTAAKGQVLDLNVYARQLRSPLDSVLSILDAKGNRIALNDDEGMPDSHLRWTVPADGQFLISIADQLKRGGPLFFYRVEVKPVHAHLGVYLPEMVQNSSQERRAIVVPKGNRYATLMRVKRQDAPGDLAMEPEGLPEGVQWSTGALEKNADTVPVVFEAAPEMEKVTTRFGVAVHAKEAPKTGEPAHGDIEHTVDVIENGNQKAFYSVTEDKLALAVTDAVPVKLTLVEPKVPVLQNGAMDLKVQIERTNDFKGPVSLTLLYSPPGIGIGGPVQIKEGQNEAKVTISCAGNAALQKSKVCVVGSLETGKGTVFISTQLVDLQVAPACIAGQIQRTFIDQGDTGSITMKLDQKTPFEGKAKLALQGLPPGVTAEEKEITKDDTEVKFALKAEPQAMVGQHKALFCQFKLPRDGEEIISNFAQGGVLRVDKASVAKNDAKK